MRIQAIVSRIIRQFFRDKRTLAMIIVAPIFILWLTSLVFSGGNIEPNIGIVDGNEILVTKIDHVKFFSDEEKAISALVRKDIHGYVNLGEVPPKIIVEGSDPTINQAVIQIAQKLHSPNLGIDQFEVNYYYGNKHMSVFDNIGPFLIGFFVFFFVFIIAGVSFLRERTSGTLEKLLSTPLKRWEIVVGYVLGFGLFTSLQTVIIVYVSIELLGMVMAGSIWLVMLVTLVLSITALTLGTLLSAFARNELQMIQFIPIVIIPQVFFSGLFSIEGLATWIQSLSVIMPLSYGGEAMRDIMIRGKGIEDIFVNIVVLLSFSILFMILNNLALKKHRKI
ncbi:ABC transporter permease [Anaerobacillus alkaliphilus]|uniref:ABC transporter permease n=1 Tax=Anaerobacillus alkaliphilus TaxID=1548597 RepID=A0A4Q0VVD6_9BACI|nr:ABC transporter permease [Anaerobacillus alkaliphilus]RXJ00697.1 ABC transporter permease [Anaerobacillus alkaliphilus]